MKKSEIFATLVDKVCEVCEVDRAGVIKGARSQSFVVARVLAVQYLRRIGLSCDDIALLIIREAKGDPNYVPPTHKLKIKSRSVDKIFNSYSSRCLESYAFCLMSREIKEYCHEQYKELYLSWMKDLPS